MKFTTVLKTVLLRLALALLLSCTLPCTPTYAGDDDFLNVDDANSSYPDSTLLGIWRRLEDTPRAPAVVLSENIRDYSIQSIRYANVGDLDESWRYYTDLAELFRQKRQDSTTARRLAAAGVTLTRVLINDKGDPFRKENWSEVLYRDLSVLTALHPENAEIALRQTEAAVVLATIYRNARKSDKISFLYEEANRLAERHPKETMIVVRTAEVAENAVIAYRDISDFAKARQWYDTLAKLVETTPAKKETALVQAKTARELSTGYCATGDLDEAIALYEEIGKLAESFPNDSKIHSRDDSLIKAQQAMTIPPLIAALLKSERLDGAETLYAALSDMNPYDSDIALAQAEAAGFLTVAYGKENDSTEKRGKMAALSENMERLVEILPLEADRIAQLAHRDDLLPSPPAIPEAIVVEKPATAGQKDIPDYESRYVEAKEKLDTAPNDAVAILRMAEAMFNLSSKYLEGNDRAKANAVYAQLAQFVREHPNNIAAARQQAAMAVTLANDTETLDSEAMYKDARALAEAYPQDLILAQRRSQAALNLAVVYMNAGTLQEIWAVREDMKKSLQNHPKDVKIIYYLADINRRMLIGFGEETSDPKTAYGYYTEVMELTTPYAHDEEIIRLQASTLRNIAILYARTGSWSDARKEFYPKLEKLLKAEKKLSALGYSLASEQAETASSFLSAALKDDHQTDARTFYKEITMLNAAYPNKITPNRFASPFAVIVTCQAQGAWELSTIYGARGKTAEVAALYKDTARLLATFVADSLIFEKEREIADETRQKIAVYQAQIGEIMVEAHRKARQSAKAAAVAKDIEKLVTIWPENEALQGIAQNVGRP